jgi:hypothetical protein
MKCPVCDADIDEGMTFCANCGSRITQPSSEGSKTIKIPSSPYDTPPPPYAPTLEPAPQPQPVSAPPSYAPPPYAPPTQPSTPPQPYNPPAPQSYTPPAPQPYTPPAYTGEGYTQAAGPPTSMTAIVSLVFGILSWVVLFGIGPIVAIIAGHMARNEINKSNGQLSGSGMAVAGLILGYAQLILLVLGCILFLIIGIFAAAAS